MQNKIDKKKVLVAMSGGVDSSVAAAILKEKGFEVAGATMKLWERGKYFEPDNDDSAVENASRVAKELSIEHYVFDFSREFECDVVVPFMKAYENGMTPNPCVFCNKSLKFGAFLERALEMGFDYIATGHYACVVGNDKDGYGLVSKNDAKDQTYVLYNMDQHILSHLLLPIGGMEKSEIREIARRFSLSCASSPDSQDICFIPDNDYCGLLLRLGCKSSEGDFKDTFGNVIGRHKGIIHYTVGQRKGLGSFGVPKYVVEIDAGNNNVVLGDNSELFGRRLWCERVNWLSGHAPDRPINAGVKIRYSAKAADGIITSEGNGAKVEFEIPQRAITPGQSAVFYDGNILLGGGIITSNNFL